MFECSNRITYLAAALPPPATPPTITIRLPFGKELPLSGSIRTSYAKYLRLRSERNILLCYNEPCLERGNGETGHFARTIVLTNKRNYLD